MRDVQYVRDVKYVSADLFWKLCLLMEHNFWDRLVNVGIQPRDNGQYIDGIGNLRKPDV